MSDPTDQPTEKEVLLREGPSVPSTDILQDSMALKDVGAQLTKGGGDSSDTTPLGGEVKEGRRRVITSAALLERCRATLTDPMGQLWGYNLRPKAVTLLVGETSAGKTTFLHNLAYNLALGNDFLGYKPPRPLRILYVDYESGEQIIAEHLDTIGIAEGWHFLDLEEVIRGKDLTKAVTEEIEIGRYDVVVLDSLMEAYPVDNENDNSEGAAQMLKVRELAQKTGTAVLIVHNAGQKAMTKRGKSGVKNLARGASVRMDKADVVLNYTIKGAKDSDERLLEVVKSRGGNLNAQIVVRFAGNLGFEVIEDTGPGSGIVKHLESKIMDLFGGLVSSEDKDGVARATLLIWLGIDQRDKAATQAVDRALGSLVTKKRLVRVGRGKYGLSEQAEQQK